jgi:signal transduction histidine kinase
MPLQVGGQTLGVLSIVRGADQPQPTPEELSLLTSVADQLGRVVESARLLAQAERAVVLEERQRLARDLHDSVTQSLYSLTLLAATVRRAAASGDLAGVEEYVGELGEIAQQALKEMRLLVYELRPPVLEQEGLVGALQGRLDAVESRAGLTARLLVEGEADLPVPVEEAFYRIALEALNNALKHAAATAVTVRIRAGDEHAAVEIVDNGRGFDPHAVRDSGGMGLLTMRERAERLGGTFTVLSAPGEGTQISVTVRREA